MKWLGATATAALLFGAAGIALDVTWLPRQASVAAPALVPPARVEPIVHAPRGCAHCGWIESKREIAPSVAERHSPRIYEYTLRMNDGSSSVFREAMPVSWRIGERLSVIDGQEPALD